MTELFARLTLDRYAALLSVPVRVTSQKSPCSRAQVNTLPGYIRRAERTSLVGSIWNTRGASRPAIRLRQRRLLRDVSRALLVTSPPRAVEETGLTLLTRKGARSRVSFGWPMKAWSSSELLAVARLESARRGSNHRGTDSCLGSAVQRQRATTSRKAQWAPLRNSSEAHGGNPASLRGGR